MSNLTDTLERARVRHYALQKKRGRQRRWLTCEDETPGYRFVGAIWRVWFGRLPPRRTKHGVWPKNRSSEMVPVSWWLLPRKIARELERTDGPVELPR